MWFDDRVVDNGKFELRNSQLATAIATFSARYEREVPIASVLVSLGRYISDLRTMYTAPASSRCDLGWTRLTISVATHNRRHSVLSLFWNKNPGCSNSSFHQLISHRTSVEEISNKLAAKGCAAYTLNRYDPANRDETQLQIIAFHGRAWSSGATD